MNTIKPILFLLLVSILSLAGCTYSNTATPPGTTVPADNYTLIEASLGEEIRLPVSHSESTTAVNIDLENDRLPYMHIVFTDVISDSRCPDGATCVRAGEAEINLSLVYDVIQPGAPASRVNEVLPLIAPGLFKEYSQHGMEINGNSFTIYFKLEPYPEAGRQIKSSDYRLLLRMTK